MEYSIVRTKRKRAAICIRDGAVTVKAPLDMTVEYIDSFVQSKRGWIEKKLAEYASKTAAFSAVADGSKALITGIAVDIVLTDEVKWVKPVPGKLLVPVKYGNSVQKAVGNWYRRVAANVLADKLSTISAATGLKYAAFALTNARGKWGSCDKDCNIRLNWRLVMLDEHTVDYVVIHELCHTRHHDHSRAFWAEVAKHCPDYAAARKSLKFYSVLTSLYR